MSALTVRQKQALAWLRAAREDQPSTDDGQVYDGPTFYDTEVKVAYVNFHTARALERRGLIEIGPPDAYAITLAAAASPVETGDEE